MSLLCSAFVRGPNDGLVVDVDEDLRSPQDIAAGEAKLSQHVGQRKHLLLINGPRQRVRREDATGGKGPVFRVYNNPICDVRCVRVAEGQLRGEVAGAVPSPSRPRGQHSSLREECRPPAGQTAPKTPRWRTWHECRATPVGS